MNEGRGRASVTESSLRFTGCKNRKGNPCLHCCLGRGLSNLTNEYKTKLNLICGQYETHSFYGRAKEHLRPEHADFVAAGAPAWSVQGDWTTKSLNHQGGHGAHPVEGGNPLLEARLGPATAAHVRDERSPGRAHSLYASSRYSMVLTAEELILVPVSMAAKAGAAVGRPN